MPNLNQFYTWCVQTCNAPNVGYSMDYRAAQTINGITYYDCSSFVYYALIAGGWTNLPSWPFTTYDMIPYLTAGGWHEVPANGTILPGDIGWNQEHVEVAYARGENGVAVFMGAHGDAFDGYYNLQDQVSIGVGGDPSIPRSFTRIFRYGDGGADQYGYSAAVVAALAGNAYIDSYINSAWLKPNGTAFGLFQWDGIRKVNMIGWMTLEGYDDDDPEGQILYFEHENHWEGRSYGIGSLNAFLTSDNNDVAELTEAFCTCWEETTDFLRDRIAFAQRAYLFIVDHAQDTSITDWIKSDVIHLTEAQALNNAVMMYRFLTAGGGGGGTPAELKRKKKIWMWIRYHY